MSAQRHLQAELHRKRKAGSKLLSTGILSLAVGLLSACVTTQPPPSRIARLSAAEAATPPVSTALSFDDILALQQSGAATETIIARVRERGGPSDFSPIQIIAAHQRGLLLPLLQAIHEEREKALHNTQAGKLAELDRLCAADIERERQRVTPCPDPYWPRPYGFWGPSRRGGASPSFMDRPMRLRSTSTSTTRTLTMSPVLTTSRASVVKVWLSWLTWTSPS